MIGAATLGRLTPKVLGTKEGPTLGITVVRGLGIFDIWALPVTGVVGIAGGGWESL